MTEPRQVSEMMERLIDDHLSFNVSNDVGIRKKLQALIGNQEISIIYPKNIFGDSKSEKVYYVIHEKHLSVIYRGSTESKVTTHPLKVKSVQIKRSNNIQFGASELIVTLENGTAIDFNTSDSDQYWQREFSKFIGEIYTEFLS